YTAPPAKDPLAPHLREVTATTPAIEAMAAGAARHCSRAGITTKVEAGRLATQAGTPMIIAKGTQTPPRAAPRQRPERAVRAALGPVGHAAGLGGDRARRAAGGRAVARRVAARPHGRGLTPSADGARRVLARGPAVRGRPAGRTRG
ncbi:hypothetical protein VW29_10195, partial [Devosia limi DSM 17137]